MTIPSVKDMIKAGVHFGHKPSRRHPSMDEYVLSVYNNVHVFDLEKTQAELQKALDFLKEKTKLGGIVLFVGTKKQAQGIVQKAALEAGMPYVTQKWLGGTITNFKVINGLVKKLNKIEDQEKSSDYEEKYTKKERLEFTAAKEKLEIMVSGIRHMSKIPDAVYLVGSYDEKTALREAKNKNIPVVAMCDTNANSSFIDYPIPANDDAIKSLEMITGLVVEAIKEGKEVAKIGDSVDKQDETKEVGQGEKEEFK